MRFEQYLTLKQEQKNILDLDPGQGDTLTIHIDPNTNKITVDGGNGPTPLASVNDLHAYYTKWMYGK